MSFCCIHLDNTVVENGLKTKLTFDRETYFRFEMQTINNHPSSLTILCHILVMCFTHLISPIHLLYNLKHRKVRKLNPSERSKKIR